MVEQREAANAQVLQIFKSATPMVMDIQTASAVIPGMDANLILHSGPPIAWAEMCGPMQGAILGAVVYEGLAPDLQSARERCDQGHIRVAPCHDHQAVAPM